MSAPNGGQQLSLTDVAGTHSAGVVAHEGALGSQRPRPPGVLRGRRRGAGAGRAAARARRAALLGALPARLAAAPRAPPRGFLLPPAPLPPHVRMYAVNGNHFYTYSQVDTKLDTVVFAAFLA